ncbi:uncharacterized protein LOC110465479 [Mizuhopecten yessoensis]|uniref:uncharacterized protein LOC110465479 n=1 Tax=Mizuhopecten yessoensis TaxID=6573 RepID=UPI000B459392|nr:uncharacterized protein LOC110465479 [Mizuhopecten yessoensis]
MTSEVSTGTTDNQQLTTCDVIATAFDLRTLLVHHDRSLQQINLIDSYMTRLTNQALIYLKQGRKGHALRILTHKAIAVGVKHLYRLYRLRKWYQVQHVVMSIIRTLQNEALPIPTQPDYSNLMDLETEQTKSISQTLTVAHCNHYRED